MLLAAALFVAGTASRAATLEIAAGPQYDTTQVYVPPQDFDRFVTSLVATFGGTTTKQGVFTVTPTPSSTISQHAQKSNGRRCDSPGRALFCR
jgi:hypothetical protein